MSESHDTLNLTSSDSLPEEHRAKVFYISKGVLVFVRVNG